MNGFCKDCSIDIFDEDVEDLAGFLSPLLAREGYGLVAHCESCGEILVDQDGQRLSAELLAA